MRGLFLFFHYIEATARPDDGFFRKVDVEIKMLDADVSSVEELESGYGARAWILPPEAVIQHVDHKGKIESCPKCRNLVRGWSERGQQRRLALIDKATKSEGPVDRI